MDVMTYLGVESDMVRRWKMVVADGKKVARVGWERKPK
jgi:hypothetical protein